jgi:hypothetical protein
MRSENLNGSEVFPIVSLLRRGKRTGNEKTNSLECFPETRETRETKGEVNGDVKGKEQPGTSTPTSKASLRDDQQPVLVLTLTPTPAGRDVFGRTPSYRLKQLLKPLLRSYGFRCDGLEWPKTP